MEVEGVAQQRQGHLPHCRARATSALLLPAAAPTLPRLPPAQLPLRCLRHPRHVRRVAQPQAPARRATAVLSSSAKVSAVTEAVYRMLDSPPLPLLCGAFDFKGGLQ